MTISMNRGLKNKLEQGKAVVGPFIKAVSPALIEIIGLSGMDYVLIDLEHSPVSMEELENLLRAADSGDVCAFVRVAGHNESDILHPLDKGAGGLLVPMVSSGESAERIVHFSKFAPQGERGMDIYSRSAKFGYISKAEYLARANEETLLAVQIEGTKGINNLPDILSVDGIDIIYIGPYDLSQSLGIPGKVHDQLVVAKVEEIVAQAKEKDRFVGIYVDDIETAQRYIALGVQFITLSVDVTIFAQACDALIDKFEKIST